MSFWDHKATTSSLQLFDGDHLSTLVGREIPLFSLQFDQLAAVGQGSAGAINPFPVVNSSLQTS